MHVLFVHKNFPAQFGQIAGYLAQRKGFRCTFVTERGDGEVGGVRLIRYRPGGGATARTHFCSRSFENYTWHSHAVYETLKAHPEVQPDLVVGHSGFGSTAFLPELYDCPVINYFEYYYHTRNSDIDFRPEFPGGELERLRARSRNAMLLLDLQTCAAGYCPTSWQRSRFPEMYQWKLATIFDGIDTDFWRRLEGEELGPRRIAGRGSAIGRLSKETENLLHRQRQRHRDSQCVQHGRFPGEALGAARQTHNSSVSPRNWSQRRWKRLS